MAEISGNTTVLGTVDDDKILGTAGVDTLSGGDGKDTITGGAGNDALTGGNGVDTVNYGSTTVNGTSYTPPVGVGVTVNLAAGTATDAHGGADTLTSIENVIGTSANDEIDGDANDNVLDGGGGQDGIRGGDGDDTIKLATVAGSIIDGGNNTLGKGDTVDYSAVTAGLTVDLSAGGGSAGVLGGLTDTLSGIENVVTGKAGTEITLEAGVRNKITHTTNVNATTGVATGAAGNGGADVVNGFQVGKNAKSDGSDNLAATFDIVDLSGVIVPVAATQSSYVRIEQVDTDSNGSVDALKVRVSASGVITGAGAAVDETSVLLKGVTYASLSAAYGGSAVTDSASALIAMQANRNLLLGNDRGTPSVSAPQAQKVVEGGEVVFNGVNTIRIADTLSGDGASNKAGQVTATVEVRAPANPAVTAGVGALSWVNSRISSDLTDGNLTNGTSSGEGTSKITLTGTVAQINEALVNLKYTAVAGGRSADQLLRVTVVDEDGKKVVRDVSLEVQAAVQNKAGVGVAEGSLLLANGATVATLGLKMTVPADNVGTPLVNEGADADGSESYSVRIDGVPLGRTLQATTGGASVVRIGADTHYTVTGTAVQVKASVESLQVVGLVPGDYPMTIKATAITTDYDFEGKLVEASSQVAEVVVNSYSTDVTAVAGQQGLGTNKAEKLYGLDAQADQLIGGTGADVLRGYSVAGTDASKSDMVSYARAAVGDAILAGVDVNLQTGKGRNGHAEGDTYVGIEGATGTVFADRFIGKAGQRNTFNGGEGNDTFVAKLSAAGQLTHFDVLSGAAGSDTISLEDMTTSIVNLNLANQDFNNDGVVDASISRIENVILGGAAGTVTLVNSTQTTIGGATSGLVNANSVLLDRMDSGVGHIVNNFDKVNDKIDLSGVLRTGLSGDLNNFVRITEAAGNTKIEIDKDKNGSFESAITLNGVTGTGWTGATGASAMATAGALVHKLNSSASGMNAAQTTDYLEGGRTRLLFDLSQGSPPAPVVGQIVTFKAGGTNVAYTVVAADIAWGIVAAKLVTAINAASASVGGSAVLTSGSLVTFTQNSLSAAAASHYDVVVKNNSTDLNKVFTLSGTGLLTGDPHSAGDNKQVYAKMTVDGVTHYGAAYNATANSLQYSQALANLALNMTTAGVKANWDGATGKFSVDTANAAVTAPVVAVLANNGSITGGTAWSVADLSPLADVVKALLPLPPILPTSISNATSEPLTSSLITNSREIAVGGLSSSGDEVNAVVDVTRSPQGHYTVNYAALVDAPPANVTLTVNGQVYAQAFTTTLANTVSLLAAQLNAAAVAYQAVAQGEVISVGRRASENSYVFSTANTTGEGTANAQSVLAKATVAGVTYYGMHYAPGASQTIYGNAIADLAQKMRVAGLDVKYDSAATKLSWSDLIGPSIGLSFAFTNLVSLYVKDASGVTPWTAADLTAVSALHVGVGGTALTGGFSYSSPPAYTIYEAPATPTASNFLGYGAVPNVSVMGGMVISAGLVNEGDINHRTTAVAEVQTLTLSGDVMVGAAYNVTINGKTFSYTAATGDTLASVGTGLAAAVNADARGVSEVWQVALNSKTVWHSGDQYKVTVNGTDYSYTVKSTDTTIGAIRDGMVNLLNGIVSKQAYAVAINAGALPAVGSVVDLKIAGVAVASFTVGATDLTKDAVVTGLQLAMEKVAAKYNFSLALNAAGDIVVTNHKNVDLAFTATGTGVTGVNTTGVYGVAPLAGFTAEGGNTAEVIKLTSANAAATSVATTYTDMTIGAPVPVVTTTSDVSKVNSFDASTDALVTAVATGAVITLTGKSAGLDLTVSAGVSAPVVEVLEGSQYLYAHNSMVETFKWRDDAIVGDDTIKDFQLGVDKLDLRGVLSGVSTTRSDYITVTDAGAGNVVTLAIDADGSAATTTDRFNITLVGAGTGSVSLSSLIDQGSLLTPSSLV